MGTLKDDPLFLTELRDREELYRTLYDTTPVMMHSIEPEGGEIVSVNEYWIQVMGYERSEVIGRKSVDFLTPASRRYAIEVTLPEFFKTGVARDVEYQMVKKDGQAIDVLLSAVAHRDETGRVLRTHAFMIDVSERKRAEETRRELAVAEERNRLAREIHDTLAQSLVAITVQLERAGRILSQEPNTAASHIESARELAQQSVEDARRSVWDLHPDRLEDGSLPEAIQAEIGRYDGDGVQTSMEVAGEQPESFDPRNELAAFRIVQEALSNVRNHSNAKSATVRLSYDVSELSILVSDDGNGFEPSEVKGMLTPTGGGFGLSSMQERARLAGGRLEIHSAQGRGTQVAAWVPYHTTPAPTTTGDESPATLEPRPAEHSGDIRVLLVDDQEMIRRGVRGMIEQSDGLLVVDEAEDGEQAVARVQTTKPDVVLLDMHMPRLDGVETMKRLRELAPETRVILLSAYATDEYIFEGLRAGASGYLLKDVGEDQLVRAIRTVHSGGSLLQPVVAKRLIEGLGRDGRPRLTARELEVLQLVASGSRDKEIAEKLSLSVRTVRFHIKNIYQKLDVGNRTAAVRVATERGMLTG